MKKKLLFLVAALALFVPSVMAAEIVVDTDLASKVASASNGDTLKLTKDVEVSTTIAINKDLTLNLNGKNVTFLNSATNFEVKGGKLTVTGAGKIAEKVPYYAPIYVIGSANEADTDYSVVTIEKDVVLEGWTGIFIRETASNTAYGVKINFNGTINNKPDSDDDKGHGIYINGNIKHVKNAPVITIGDNAVINSQGTGIYAAGYAIWNIGKAKITGVECGLGIKSGVFNIDGVTVKATGEDTTPTAGYGNGINSSGAAIQIESNTGYVGNIELNIKSGTFTSEKGIAVYEYLDTKGSTPATDTAVKTIKIEGGNFTSVAKKPAMVLSDEFTKKYSQTGFITGGTFSSDVAVLLSNTYVSEKEGTNYVVKENKVLVTEDKNVTFESEKAIDSTNTLKVTKKEDEKVVKAVTDSYKENTKVKDTEVLVVYDINVVNANGGVVEMRNGKYTITVTLPSDKLDFDVYKVIYVDEEGNASEPLDAKIVDGKLVFTTTHLSTYAVVGYNNVEDKKNEVEEETSKTDTTEETKKEENPDTGDINLALIIGTILVGTLGVVVTSKKISAKVTR